MTESTSDGWLMHFGDNLRATIGLREMLFVLPDDQETHPVPRTHAHAASVYLWQQNLVPVIDLHRYLRGSTASGAPGMMGIVACASTENSSSHTRLGALKMSRPPERIQVSDQQACELPAELAAAWRSISASCFRHPVHGAVPILDLAAILIPA
jgi:chemotaxis signal transduction protein